MEGDLEQSPTYPTHRDDVSAAFKFVLFGLAIVLVGSLGYMVWKQNISTYSDAAAIVAHPSLLSSNQFTYTNTTYRFSIRLSGQWAGFKVKTTSSADAQITAGTLTNRLFVNLPTSDPNYAEATDTTAAGFAEAMEVDVYSLAQWQAAGGDAATSNGTKFGQNSGFVVSYLAPETTPAKFPSLADVQAAAATFKAL